MKTKNRLALALALTAVVGILASCSSEKTRDSSSSSSASETPPLADSTDSIISEIESSSFPNDCVTYLQNFESTLSALKSAQLVEKGPLLAKGFWKVQLALHDHLPDVSVDCVKEIRNTEKLLRSAEDYLIEREAAPLDDPNFPYQSFYRRGISTSFQFKDGDILITRGNDFLSTLLSRTGDYTAQFSQLIFIHVDPDTKEMRGMSAYIGAGAKLISVEKTILENALDNVRVLILRGKDQDLASRAAEFTFKRFTSQLADGRVVPFDYSLTTSDHSAFTSPKIVQYGYETISNGDFELPQHPSHFSEETWLTKRMGLQPSDIFNPSDIEVDARFDLIGEWRNPKLTEASRRKDVVLETTLQWIKNEDYTFQSSTRSAAATDEGQWPFFAKAPASHALPKKIPHKILYNAAQLNFVTDILLNELTREDHEFKKKTSVPMSAGELRTALEKFKTADFQVWKNPKTHAKSKLHLFFRPN
jgi:hypothetical protein